MKKKLFILSTMLLIAIGAHAAKAYCVYSSGTLTFYYDDQMSSRKGTKYDLVYQEDGSPKWLAKASSVKKVVFNSSFADARPENGAYWFYKMSNLTTIQNI